MKNKIKNKLKTFFKCYLPGFILGIISACTISVIAATYFPSNQTTYDNTKTELKSENVQDAIDELYGVCLPSAGDQIIEDAGLEKDPYECRYFFTGANPNNYVTFNNEEAGWRIISVECDGTIKIMRTASIGEIAWDSSYSNNSNDWARPATLNTYLNGTYYNGLNNTAQSQIVAKDWSIGAVTYSDNNMANTINNEKSKKWNGNIALVTVSEYVRSNSNRSSCGTVVQLWKATGGQCRDTTWMHYSNNWWWTLSPSSDYSNYVFHVGYYNGDSHFYSSGVYNTLAVRPAVYLSSEVKITGGNGSQNNPYTLS